MFVTCKIICGMLPNPTVHKIPLAHKEVAHPVLQNRMNLIHFLFSEVFAIF